MFGSLTLDDMLMLVLVWMVSSAVYSLIFVRYIVLKYAGVAMVNAITDPDPKQQKALNTLFERMWTWLGETNKLDQTMSKAWVWFMTCEVSYKETEAFKDEEGKEQTREIEKKDTPFNMLFKNLGRYITLQLRAYKGGAASQFARDMADSPMGQALGQISPMALKRAMKDGDYAGVLMEMLLPKIIGKINKTPADTAVAQAATWRPE